MNMHHQILHHSSLLLFKVLIHIFLRWRRLNRLIMKSEQKTLSKPIQMMMYTSTSTTLNFLVKHQCISYIYPQSLMLLLSIHLINQLLMLKKLWLIALPSIRNIEPKEGTPFRKCRNARRWISASQPTTMFSHSFVIPVLTLWLKSHYGNNPYVEIWCYF